MIYDPVDINLAMDEKGCLYYRTADGTTAPEWAPLVEIKQRKEPNKDEFTHPQW